MNWFIATFFVLAVISGMTVVAEWQGCSERGGRMVQGLDWNGYVCVEGK